MRAQRTALTPSRAPASLMRELELSRARSLRLPAWAGVHTYVRAVRMPYMGAWAGAGGLRRARVRGIPDFPWGG